MIKRVTDPPSASVWSSLISEVVILENGWMEVSSVYEESEEAVGLAGIKYNLDLIGKHMWTNYSIMFTGYKLEPCTKLAYCFSYF